MGPSVKKVNNEATPVAADFIKYLEGLLAQNGGPSPAGPLQQGAGKAITNYVNTGINRMASGGVDPGTEALIGALTTRSNTQTNRAAGDLREAFGAAGNRYSSALGKSEALLRSDAGSQLDFNIGQILSQRQGQNESNVLAAISEMARQGEASIVPYLALLQQGLRPAENIVSPGIGSQILAGATSAGASYLGRGR